MDSPAVGSVVLVRFPFSDLSSSKLRPAVVLASVEREDFVLCQITSNPYADQRAVEIKDRDFNKGSLMRKSYARPGKLFSANTAIMSKVIGELHAEKIDEVIFCVVRLLTDDYPDT